MRSVVSLAVLALLLAGCGGSHRSGGQRQSRTVANAGCVSEGLAAAPLSGESGVYRAGPVTLSIGEDLAQIPSQQLNQPMGSEAIALVTGDRPALVRVHAVSTARMSLQFTPLFFGHPNAVMSDGLPAVRFPACGRSEHRFGGGVLFAGRGCVRLDVTTANGPRSTMLIPIGDSLKGCPALDTSASLPSSALPFLGTACGKANSIQCDRIGVGVTLDEDATLVVVRIAGRLVTLSPPDPTGSSNIWLGYLQGAGPAHGPLRVRAPRHDGLWFGTPLRFARARVIAFFPDGRVDSEAATVMVHPGFG
jgi:hypothetical protein